MTAKTLLLLTGAVLLQRGLADGVSEAYAFSDLAAGPRLLVEHVLIFLGGFCPALIVNGALVGPFRPRRAFVALPLSTGLMFVCWVWWLWGVFAQKFPDISISSLRWSLLGAAPLGLGAASALIAIVAKSQGTALQRA